MRRPICRREGSHGRSRGTGMTESTELRFAAGIAAAFAALHLAGAFLPGPLTWGFATLAFLPWWMTLLYAALAAAGIAYALRGPLDGLLEPAGAAMEQRWWGTLLAAGCVLALMALLLRVRAP